MINDEFARREERIGVAFWKYSFFEVILNKIFE